MNLLRLRSDLSGARRATGLMLALLSVSVAANLILAIASVRFAHRERVVVVPPTVHRSFWVEADQVSPEYLEQMGYFLLQLCLNVTPQSVEHQSRLLLKYVAASSSGELRASLAAAAERVKRDGASTIFSAEDFTVDPANRRLTVRGRLTTFISDRRVAEVQKSYALSFDVDAGRILLKSFRESQTHDPLDTRPDDSPAGA